MPNAPQRWSQRDERDGSGDRGGGRGWPGRHRLIIGPQSSLSGGDPKIQLAKVHPGEDTCHRLIALV
jgi:hypothetical protein